MKEQRYEIKLEQNNIAFELKDIFDCGQCFRWNSEEDGSYTGIFKNNVINVKKTNEIIVFEGNCEGEIKEIITEYFDLNRNYNDIKEKLSKIDDYMKQSVQFGKGIIERLSKTYGKEIIWKDKKYYTFPTAEELKNVSIEEYRKLGLGFRDERVYKTTKMILEKQINLEELRENKNTIEVREKLLTMPGVGPKVADCILLFSDLKRLEVFPIDVWVRRIINDLYLKEADENKVSKTKIENLAKEKFGDIAGLAQQYLFYWRREQA